jgi:hypothetical protein
MKTIEEADFRDVKRYPLTFGITSLYVGNVAGIEERSRA